MIRQEHVHIITAGENIHHAYPAALRELPDITHTFVFADTELYTNSARDDERTKAMKAATRKSVDQVKSISASLKIPCPLIYIIPPVFASAKDNMLKILKDRPDANYSFDITAGSKDLSLALFQLALWCGGTIWYKYTGSKDDRLPEHLAVPKATAADTCLNPNYRKVLSVLSSAQGSKGQENRILPRSYLFTQLESFYVPVRKKGVRTETSPTKTDLFTGKRAVIPVLSQGTFSNFLSAMIAYGLIREMAGPDGNRKEKYYRITPMGELALQFS